MKVFMETRYIYNGRVINHKNLIPSTNVSRWVWNGDLFLDGKLLEKFRKRIYIAVFGVPFNVRSSDIIGSNRSSRNVIGQYLFTETFSRNFTIHWPCGSRLYNQTYNERKNAIRGEWEPLQLAGWLSPLPPCSLYSVKERRPRYTLRTAFLPVDTHLIN